MEPAIIESFRVKPNAGRYYVQVMVFPTLPSLRRYTYAKLRKEEIAYPVGAFEAVFLAGTGACVGLALFSKTRMHPGIVTYELTHAAIHWARLTKLDPVNDTVKKTSKRKGDHQEERFVTGVDVMVRQFFRKYPIEE